MRFSTVAVALAAAMTASAQGPVTQISDGQLQVPPSTAIPVYSTVPVVATSIVSAASSAASSAAPVVPVPSYPAGNSSAIVSVPTGGYTNSTLLSTVAPTVAPTTTGGAASTPVSATGSAATPTGTGAAGSTFGNAIGSLSFAALAMAGFVLA